MAYLLGRSPPKGTRAITHNKGKQARQRQSNPWRMVAIVTLTIAFLVWLNVWYLQDFTSELTLDKILSTNTDTVKQSETAKQFPIGPFVKAKSSEEATTQPEEESEGDDGSEEEGDDGSEEEEESEEGDDGSEEESEEGDDGTEEESEEGDDGSEEESEEGDDGTEEEEEESEEGEDGSEEENGDKASGDTATADKGKEESGEDDDLNQSEEEDVPRKTKKIPVSTSNDEENLAAPATTSHRVAGLSCEKYGGPSDEVAAEMVYWQDIPKDAAFTSPYANYGPTPKYLTFEPDEGGWNNIRMSMETATVLAHAMGRILVLPPEQNMYLLSKDKRPEKNKFTFKDFFHFDSIADEHPAVEVISMEEFLQREAGTFKNKYTGQISFPPENATTWNGHGRHGRKYWMWLRNVTQAPIWFFDECVVGFPSEAGPEAAERVKGLREEVARYKKEKMFYIKEYDGNPTPVDGSPQDRLKEQLGDRRTLQVYGDTLQNEKVMHFMGDNDSGARLLVHFYAFLFFEDYHQELWTKRFVRDHLRYVDEIQCTAARLVDAMRQKAREHGDPEGNFDTFHIRRGDFQYKETRIEATQIYENVKDVLVENSTIYIATDEKDKSFFEPIMKHYNVYFMSDFKHLLGDINTNYMGMLDQRVASRGRMFIGAYYSTFTGYINRMRGYHSQKDKLPGWEKGEINSYFYVPLRHKLAMKTYKSIHAPMWSREFPTGWRDIDHDLEQATE
eukprot:Nitzschia sp. Nitz4//scaffold179_size51476//34375//36661//NITZ4_006929-RA/size51476-augustus-gene-0.1-mRNA-1//1//CDS//3329539225//8567//frame0